MPPPFRLGAHYSDLYDMSSFYGRLRYNWACCSPLGLVHGQAAVDRANSLLDAHASGSLQGRDAELWDALHVRATCAPRGELLPLPVRPCGWALGGTPCIAFMLFSAVRWPTALAPMAFGQWLNQTHLAACNWCNRGGSAAGGSPRQIGLAYVAACAAAVPMAFGAAVTAQRWSLLRPFARFAPYPGVAAANATATAVMRWPDVTDGVPVYAEPREGAAPACGEHSTPRGPVGLSRAAGRAAVRDTSLTRLVLPIGNFIVVPLLLLASQRVRRKPPTALAQLGVTAAVFTIWLPASFSLIPPVGRLPLSELEPEILERISQQQHSDCSSSSSSEQAECLAVIYERGL